MNRPSQKSLKNKPQNKPQDPRAVALSVLYTVLEGGYAAPTLDTALRRAKLESRDAGLCTHLVYGTLRYWYALEPLVTQHIRPNTPPKAKLILMLGAFEKLILETAAHAVVNEYVELAKRDLGKISGVVNAVLRKLEPLEPNSRSRYALSEWLEGEFDVTYGEQSGAVKIALLQPSPLWLWCSDEGIALLEDEGAVVETGHQDIYKVILGQSLASSKAYQHGQVQPINPASFAVTTSLTDALGDVSGKRVLDLAGGNGIKASFLARMGFDVTSIDLDGRKHVQAQKNLERMGLSASFLEADLTLPLPETVLAAPFVLLDAPCTGTGTLRGHPEIKLRLRPEDQAQLVEIQAKMLENAAAKVEAGGVLVYSVCAISLAEGEQQIAAFLERHPEFASQKIPLELPHIATQHGVYTLPLAGVDGFYIARVVRS